LFNEQLVRNNELKKLVDEKIINFKSENWHYVSRLKSIESFALKIESGRFHKPQKLEDFFACMIVVENINAIKQAEELIKNHFEISERRPKSDNQTHKHSNSFQFDDIRLYLTWKDDPKLPPKGVSDILFEVQIKTFLQHAWSIATHDLIYKTDSVNWAQERIAFQIKAMLEHAEISILEVDKLAKSNSLNKTNRQTKELLNILKLLCDFWDIGQLPNNIVTLARNVQELLNNLKIDLKKLKNILNAETKQGKGARILNLSPYGAIIQSLLNHETEKVINYLLSDTKQFKILLPNEIDLPKSIKDISSRNAIFLNS